MKQVVYYRNGKFTRGLKVTITELNALKTLCDFISISGADYTKFKDLKGDDIAGVIVGKTVDDLNAIFEKANIPYDGNISENPDCWLVSDPEAHGYKSLNSEFTFGEVIELAQLGCIIARKNWNGNRKDDGEFELRMFVIYVPGSTITVRANTPYGDAGLEGKTIKLDPHFDLYTPAGTVQPGWLASQADIFATDWVVVKLPKNI